MSDQHSYEERIVELQEQNKNLQAEAIKYRTLFDSFPHGITVSDSDGKVLESNSTSEQLLGISKNEQVKRKIDGPDWRIIRPDGTYMPSEEVAGVIALKENRLVSNYEMGVAKSSDEKIWLNVTAAPIPLKGHGVIITYNDITERKRAEEAREKCQAQLIQFEKAESLGRMAGAIAHTFNNQMAVVIGNLELALVNMPQDAALLEPLTAAMQGAHKAAEVSGLMLTYLGQKTGKYISMDLSEICRQSVSSSQASALKETTLNVDLLTPGPVIRGNANQIQQVLVNLVTNAWEAMNKRQGEIDVIVKTLLRANIPPMLCFPSDWKPENETYACLEIRDTGCGIEEKDIDKVFDPFFSSKFAGRGLGLAVVLGIIKVHGGAVAVDSEKGEGSSFKVYLPIAAESVAQ